MLRSHRLGAMMKSVVSRVATKQFDGCAHTHMYCCSGALYSLNHGWFSAFNFVKIIKYACDRKFTDVYVCQKLSN